MGDGEGSLLLSWDGEALLCLRKNSTTSEIHIDQKERGFISGARHSSLSSQNALSGCHIQNTHHLVVAEHDHRLDNKRIGASRFKWQKGGVACEQATGNKLKTQELRQRLAVLTMFLKRNHYQTRNILILKCVRH